MVVIKSSVVQRIVFFSSFLSELHMKWALCRTFLVSFGAFISRLTLLASIAIEDIDAISIWVVPLSPFRNHLDVLWGKHFIHLIPYGLDVRKPQTIEH